jgi:6-phosphogluconolactonase/Glucosamine-6-phosphate isomerase/deaminase
MNTTTPLITGLYVVHSKEDIPETLFQLLHQSLIDALQDSPSEFHIALSGGSLPSLLTALPQSFASANIDPQWHKWRVILADERLVPSSHPDSNLKALKECFLDKVPIPAENIYGIDESLLSHDHPSMDIAVDYEQRVFLMILKKSRDDECTFSIVCYWVLVPMVIRHLCFPITSYLRMTVASLCWG